MYIEIRGQYYGLICHAKFGHGEVCQSGTTLFVPFRDAKQFQTSHGKCYTRTLQAAVHANAITGKSLVRLQYIQNCHNMMKAGRQNDKLERITVPLPAPVKTKAKDYDEEKQKELENHIEMFLTELVADMDEDNALQSP